MKKNNVIKLMVALLLIVGSSIWVTQLRAQKKKTPTKKIAVKNEITLTMDGATTKYTDGVNAVIIQGKFMGITNAKGNAHVGDSEKLIAKSGSFKDNAHIFFTMNGYTLMDNGKSCSITITYYDGTTIKGTFAADLHPDVQSSNGKKVAVGTFQTNDILKF